MSPPSHHILGIDIGGSGVKAAPVDVRSGELLEPRQRIVTPESGSPESILEIVAELRSSFSWGGDIGCAFPGVVRGGRTLTATNLASDWIGLESERVFSERLGCSVKMINDADAAGLAEVAFGAARSVSGVVIMVTLGTGIGTAIFNNGVLLPNTELGHLQIDGVEGESRAASRIREKENLGWDEWAQRVSWYLRELERLFWPDLFVVGGGVSRKFAKFGDGLQLNTKVVPAAMANEAGVVGAALVGASGEQRRSGE